MGWTWKYVVEGDAPTPGPEAAAGTAPTIRQGSAAGPAGEGPVAPGQSEVFTSQSDAETWLGENYRTLLEEGVTAVTLLEDEVKHYTMSLTPPAGEPVPGT